MHAFNNLRGGAAFVTILLACTPGETPVDTETTTEPGTGTDPGATTGTDPGVTTGTPPTTSTGDTDTGDTDTDDTGGMVCASESAVVAGFTLGLGDWPATDGAYAFDAPCLITDAEVVNGGPISYVLACTDEANMERLVSLVLSGSPAPAEPYVDAGLDVTLKVRRPAGVGDDGGSFALFYGGDMYVVGTNAPEVGDADLFGMFTVTATPQGCTPVEYMACATAQTFDLVIDGGPLSDAHYGQGFAGTEGSQVYLSIFIERAMQVSGDPMACPLDPGEANTFKYVLTYSPI